MEDIIMSGWTGPTGTLSFTNTSGNQEGKVYNAKTQTIVKYKRDFDFQDLGSEVAARYRYQYKDISTPWCKLTITGDNMGLSHPVQVHWESNIALHFESWTIYFTNDLSNPLQTWVDTKTSATEKTIGNFSVMDFDHIEITFTQPVNNASIASALTTGKGVSVISFNGTKMFDWKPVLNMSTNHHVLTANGVANLKKLTTATIAVSAMPTLDGGGTLINIENPSVCIPDEGRYPVYQQLGDNFTYKGVLLHPGLTSSSAAYTYWRSVSISNAFDGPDIFWFPLDIKNTATLQGVIVPLYSPNINKYCVAILVQDNTTHQLYGWNYSN